LAVGKRGRDIDEEREEKRDVKFRRRGGSSN
jgi:hypothetical protein